MTGFLIFEMLSSSIYPIGMIENYTSLMYTDYDNDVGSFTLKIPYTSNAFELVKRNNGKEKLILLDNRGQKYVFGVCHKVCPKNDSSEKSIEIQGTLIEGILRNYCVGLVERLKTATVLPQKLRNFPLSLQYELSHLPNDISGDFWQGISYELPTDYLSSTWDFSDGYLGGRCTFDDYIGSCTRQLRKSYSLDYNVQTNRFALNLYSPKDRTVLQHTNSQILISTSFGDILSSEYYLNSKDFKNIIVAYANIDDRYYQQVITYDDIDENYPTESKRVDYNEVLNISATDSSGQELSQEDILGLLNQEGKKLLYEAELKSEYNCIFSQGLKYEYGVDYQLGDKISIQDNELGVFIDAKITGYTVTRSMYSDSFQPIIGVSQPSLTRILKQKGVI